jgi:hypothetical protein
MMQWLDSRDNFHSQEPNVYILKIEVDTLPAHTANFRPRTSLNVHIFDPER